MMPVRATRQSADRAGTSSDPSPSLRPFMMTLELDVLPVPVTAVDVPPPPRDLAPVVEDSTMLVAGLALCFLLVGFVYWRRSRTGRGGDGAPGR